MANKLAPFQVAVIDPASGRLVPGATITVVETTVGSPLASLFTNRLGTVVKSNPFVTSDGFVTFYAPGGSYNITATLGAFSRTWLNYGIGTAGEYDASDLLFGFAIAFGATGKPAAAEALLPFDVPLEMTLTTDLTGWYARVRVAPTTSKVITIMYSSGGNTAGVAIGTITFGASSREGVFSFTADVPLIPGDQIWLVMPNPASTVMSDFSASLIARR